MKKIVTSFIGILMLLIISVNNTTSACPSNQNQRWTHFDPNDGVFYCPGMAVWVCCEVPPPCV
jgi:hypothetical protein